MGSEFSQVRRKQLQWRLISSSLLVESSRLLTAQDHRWCSSILWHSSPAALAPCHSGRLGRFHRCPAHPPHTAGSGRPHPQCHGSPVGHNQGISRLEGVQYRVCLGILMVFMWFNMTVLQETITGDYNCYIAKSRTDGYCLCWWEHTITRWAREFLETQPQKSVKDLQTVFGKELKRTWILLIQG